MLLLGAAACQQIDEAPDTVFVFTVKKNGPVLAFTGVEGTRWSELSYSCKTTPCEFILDNDGLNTNKPVSVFGIIFTVTDKEVSMTSAAGTSWDVLSYSCGGRECSFRVTEKGVTGI